MKKYLTLLVVLSVIVFCFSPLMRIEVSAVTESEWYDGLEFELSEDGTMYKVIDAKDDLVDIVIPSEYKGLPVTRIESEAFREVGFNRIKSVTMPNTVTSMGDMVFSGCSKLEEVVLSANLKSIPRSTFHWCNSLKSVKMPNKLESIGDRAFLDCENLKVLEIPETVTTIGEMAFDGCKSLEKISIPDNITEIASRTFNCCESLATVQIGSGVTEIELYAFNGCKALTSVTLPNVVNISAEAFEGCESLSSVEFGESLEKIYRAAFKNCISLENVTIPDSVLHIGEEAFYGCKFTKVTLTCPGEIEDKAFGYKYDSWEEKESKITDFTIEGVSGVGGAQAYAERNGFNFVALETPVDDGVENVYTNDIVNEDASYDSYDSESPELNIFFIIIPLVVGLIVVLAIIMKKKGLLFKK
ncbi:MAG: leucine-rich repeat domain-containing protein [Clostridia bacterium]|nr:leucine-rich repeat domain-containing protein [Clostridia bacterium]